MKKIGVGLVFLLVLLFSFNVNAATFDFQFDDFMDDSLGTNYWVGSGTFEVDFDMVVGQAYRLDFLSAQGSGFSFDFNFNNNTIGFTENDISIDYDQVNVIVFNSSQGQQIRFEEVGSPNGAYGGSLEFDTTAYLLSFGPKSNPMNYTLAGDASTEFYWKSGDYGAVNAVPVPAAIWLLGSGIAGLALVRRKTKALSL